MHVKVKINDKLCIGSGSCVMIASENFELDEQGKALVKENKKVKGKDVVLSVNSTQRKKLIEAAQACPAQAISIVDETDKKIYPSE